MIYSNNVILNVKAGLSKFFITVLLLHFSVLTIAQNKESADSLVHLVEAKSAHLLEIDSVAFRKIIGPATFLHNNTYLKCDTALWNVNANIIDAIGNVEILQENTRLTSDRIEYEIALDLAKFRGSLVELMDRDGNVLNTNYLNYNTKDSVATFFSGASMRSNDGSIIESLNGTYAAKEKRFSFEDKVQIFTDSVFMVSNKVDYYTDTDVVVFNENTVAWRDENILFANSGNFNRPSNVFTFNKDGYIVTKDQELWGDLLKYYRNTGDADLYKNVQILDTVQSSICLADRVVYTPSQRKIELRESPAVGLYTMENDMADTLFLAADIIVYKSLFMYQVDSLEKVRADERIKLSEIDAIAIHDEERRAAKAKPQQIPEGKKPIQGNLVSGNPMSNNSRLEEEARMPVDRDTLNVELDSETLVQADSTEVMFLQAFHNVKFHRKDIQGVCDSLVYTGLDSMARFYIRPVMWYEEINQFLADSIQAVIKGEQLHKINLLANAFIAVQEDTVHYNQIKSAEMAAYFNNSELTRFDALGGVSAIFYMREDSTITLMDQEECKMLTAKIKDNQVQRTRSIGELKQNVFPVFNLSLEKQRLKGFEWRGAERPVTRYDVTSRSIRKSSRRGLEERELPEYEFTHKYFPEAVVPIMDYREAVLRKKAILKDMKTEDHE